LDGADSEQLIGLRQEQGDDGFIEAIKQQLFS
jgi:hypothetical protein